MLKTRFIGGGIAAAILALFALPAAAQSFRVQCPAGTVLHPATVPATRQLRHHHPAAGYQSEYESHR